MAVRPAACSERARNCADNADNQTGHVRSRRTNAIIAYSMMRYAMEELMTIS
jgi:hypothetical protein